MWLHLHFFFSKAKYIFQTKSNFTAKIHTAKNLCWMYTMCTFFISTPIHTLKINPVRTKSTAASVKFYSFVKDKQTKQSFAVTFPRWIYKTTKQNKKINKKKKKTALWQCCCYHSQKGEQLHRSLFLFSSVIIRLQRSLTLNCPHRDCSTVLCLWFARRWRGPIITVAAMTACAALWAEAADTSWPAGKSAIPILSLSLKQITLFPWPVIGWQMGHGRCCSTCSVCLKCAATRRGLAGLCNGTTLLRGFNLCLVSGTAWKWRARVAAYVARRSDLVEHRCFCYFRWRGAWCTCVLSLNPRHKGSIKSFTQWRSLWGRSGWWPGYGLTQGRGWSASSHCA